MWLWFTDLALNIHVYNDMRAKGWVPMGVPYYKPISNILEIPPKTKWPLVFSLNTSVKYLETLKLFDIWKCKIWFNPLWHLSTSFAILIFLVNKQNKQYLTLQNIHWSMSSTFFTGILPLNLHKNCFTAIFTSLGMSRKLTWETSPLV